MAFNAFLDCMSFHDFFKPNKKTPFHRLNFFAE